jgi:hypothetical protein
MKNKLSYPTWNGIKVKIIAVGIFYLRSLAGGGAMTPVASNTMHFVNDDYFLRNSCRKYRNNMFSSML